jgi:hypothetical protein
MRALALPLLLLVAGCNLNLPSLQGTWRELRDGLPGVAKAQFALTGSGFDAAPEPAEDGPVLRLNLGGRRAHARLLSEIGERRLWRTPAGLTLATEGGRVVATSGLNQSLTATRFETADPLLEPRGLLDRPRSVRRELDLATRAREPGGLRFGVLVQCRLRGALLAEDRATLLVEERCTAATLPDFTNRFWLEAASGAVLRSEQWIGPGLPLLRLEELSPAS